MLTYGQKRAINEINSLFRGQWKNGMIPSIIFTKGQTGYAQDAKYWKVKREISGTKVATSGITQSPLVGAAIWEIYKNSAEREEMLEFLKVIYPKLLNYHKFLLTVRDPNKEGLAYVTHPWSTGMDNSPAFDPIILKMKAKGMVRDYIRKDIIHVPADQRPTAQEYACYNYLVFEIFRKNNYDQSKIYHATPFLVQDVLFNSILYKSIKSQIKIGIEIGEDVSELAQLAKRMENGIQKLWDDQDGLFYSYDLRSKIKIKEKAISSLMPLYAKIATSEQAARLVEHLKDSAQFWPTNGYPVPSVSLDSPKFNAIRYWKGPVWIQINWFLIKGLENYGFRRDARELREKTLKLVQEGYEVRGKELFKLAADVLEENSYGEEFTTPSKKQYCHQWNWDSAFAAIGWSRIKKRVEKKVEEEGPLFHEYYAPITYADVKAGTPLGIGKCSVTAALIIDLLHL